MLRWPGKQEALRLRGCGRLSCPRYFRPPCLGFSLLESFLTTESFCSFTAPLLCLPENWKM